jgi:hypothetical protein
MWNSKTSIFLHHLFSFLTDRFAAPGHVVLNVAQHCEYLVGGFAAKLSSLEVRLQHVGRVAMVQYFGSTQAFKYRIISG